VKAPEAIPGQKLVDEPRRMRHELAWTIELPDGRRAVLAQLAPELAAQPALRRRWVADMERVAALPAPRLAPTLKIGPPPDPRAPDAEPPWRVRLDPPGQTLDAVLRRAPLPIDEAIDLAARLADTLHTFHAAGAVLRDLDPRSVVVGDDGQLWLTDVGHARLAILSSRTASSLLLESSPYVAPEALLRTVVDVRADVFSAGVVLWRALTGRVPFEASLLSARMELPALAELRPEAPPALVALVGRCLAHDPEQRPPTARDVAAALRGHGTETALVVVRAKCQACGALMRAGLRLCLSCGKQAVQFHRATPEDPDAVMIILDKASDDALFMGKLHTFYDAVATEIPRLNFVVGDRRMYSKSELAQRHALPAVLLSELEPATGTALVTRLKSVGVGVRALTPRKLARKRRRNNVLKVAGVGGVFGSIVALASGSAGVAALGGFGMIVAAVLLMVGFMSGRRDQRAAKRFPVGELRNTPAALPAGDELVAMLADTLRTAKSPDVRIRLEELAALVQRLCDAKASSDPVKPLVALARTTIDAIEAIDQQLGTLDEAAIVRGLARSEARHEAPELRVDLLAGLDTLRQLEDQRAKLFGRLLEITSLARTAIERGLAEAAELRSDDIEVAHALAELSAT
jgi:serine/threonine-protein kinase